MAWSAKGQFVRKDSNSLNCCNQSEGNLHCSYTDSTCPIIQNMKVRTEREMHLTILCNQRFLYTSADCEVTEKQIGHYEDEKAEG